jgi:outer membrane protein TolC
VPAFESTRSLTKRGERADVLSARASYESSEQANRETYYRSLPELTLSGQYSLHGLGLSYSEALDQVTGLDKPTYAIGLNFTVPLDYSTLTKVRSGYKEDFESAKDALSQSEISARSDWDQLQRNWTNVKSRLALAVDIQGVQEKRVRNEQNMFERGRTTTFQLITAENDLDDATLNVYRLVFESILTYAQTELYATQPL